MRQSWLAGLWQIRISVNFHFSIGALVQVDFWTPYFLVCISFAQNLIFKWIFSKIIILEVRLPLREYFFVLFYRIKLLAWLRPNILP